MPTITVRRATATAALALFASLTTSAFAAGVEFRWKDLDLTTASGKAEFDRRVEVAARQICTGETMTGTRIDPSRTDCVAGVREEIVEKIAARSHHAPAIASATPQKAR